LSGEELNLYFLKIENKFSKQGYHNKSTIKKGEMFSTLLYKIISKTPEARPKKYEPESPK
tara:strand:+ start:355 stop:534 length:180 start_codon:yes stop_codon:yes gene_type:complete